MSRAVHGSVWLDPSEQLTIRVYGRRGLRRGSESVLATKRVIVYPSKIAGGGVAYQSRDASDTVMTVPVLSLITRVTCSVPAVFQWVRDEVSLPTPGMSLPFQSKLGDTVSVMLPKTLVTVGA